MRFLLTLIERVDRLLRYGPPLYFASRRIGCARWVSLRMALFPESTRRKYGPRIAAVFTHDGEQ